MTDGGPLREVDGGANPPIGLSPAERPGTGVSIPDSEADSASERRGGASEPFNPRFRVPPLTRAQPSRAPQRAKPPVESDETVRMP